MALGGSFDAGTDQILVADRADPPELASVQDEIAAIESRWRDLQVQRNRIGRAGDGFFVIAGRAFSLARSCDPSKAVQVTYDTPRAKIEALVAEIKQLIAHHPLTNKMNFHVRFNDFGESSLNILVYFYFAVTAPPCGPVP